METILAIAALIAVAIWAIGEVRHQTLRNKQIPKLKEAVRRAELDAYERTIAEMESTTTATDLVDKLNRLR